MNSIQNLDASEVSQETKGKSNHATEYVVVVGLCVASFLVGYMVNDQMEPAVTDSVVAVVNENPSEQDNTTTQGTRVFEKFYVEYYQPSPAFGIGPAPESLTLNPIGINYIGQLLHNNDETIPAVVREVAAKVELPTIYKIDSQFRHADDYYTDYLGEWYLVCEYPSALVASSVADAKKAVQDRWQSDGTGVKLKVQSESLYGKQVGITCPYYTVIQIKKDGTPFILQSPRA